VVTRRAPGSRWFDWTDLDTGASGTVDLPGGMSAMLQPWVLSGRTLGIYRAEWISMEDWTGDGDQLDIVAWMAPIGPGAGAPVATGAASNREPMASVFATGSLQAVEGGVLFPATESMSDQDLNLDVQISSDEIPGFFREATGTATYLQLRCQFSGPSSSSSPGNPPTSSETLVTDGPFPALRVAELDAGPGAFVPTDVVAWGPVGTAPRLLGRYSASSGESLPDDVIAAGAGIAYRLAAPSGSTSVTPLQILTSFDAVPRTVPFAGTGGGERPWVMGQRVLATPLFEDGRRDLNGDGDMDDLVPLVVRISDGAAAFSDAPYGVFRSVAGSAFLMEVREGPDSGDLNGDGDMDDDVAVSVVLR
ncbi:MAG: hypothetical protein AAFP86_12375, partial [Planctomycetota bacterium]